MIHEDKVRENIRLYHSPVEMPGGYNFHTVNTLKRIALYYNSRFESGNTDEMGNIKYFYNIVKPACDIASKMIDIDTKDVLLIPEQNDDYRISWLMQKDLKQYFKETEFGRFLNSVSYNLPIWGHTFIKRLKQGDWTKVNIMNMRFDPSSQSQETDTFMYEVHTMTKRAIKNMPWDEEAKEELFARNKEEQRFLVYECYDINDEEGGKMWKRTFRADLFKSKGTNGETIDTAESLMNEELDYMPSVLLHEDEMDELPYRELRFEEVDGRRLGMGFVEYLFDNQMKVNEIENLEGRALAINSLVLFQTTDENIGRNLLDEKQNGDVITSPSGLSPIPVENRNLSGFNNQKTRWDNNTREKTFSTDVVRGESMPSGTTLGATQIAAGMVASYFDIKRENFGMFIKSLILDDILPHFKKVKSKEHIVKFIGSDAEIEKLYGAVADATLKKKLFEYLRKNGLVPNKVIIDQQREKIVNQLRKRKDIFFKVKEAAYSDVKVKVDVVITGESMNVGSRVNTLQVGLQILAANPQIMENKAMRTMFFKMISLSGISPNEIDLLEQQVETELNQQEQQPQKTRALPNAQKTPILKEEARPGFEKVPEGVQV